MIFSEKQFKEILESVYKKGEESENVTVLEFIDQIKQQIILKSTKMKEGKR